MSATTRLRQGARALVGFARPVDVDLAAGTLTPDLLVLFRRLKRVEQLHSLNVLRALLRQRDAVTSDLAVAALLHDVGKACYPLALWQKVIAVLVRKVLPSRAGHWSDGEARGWRRPFVVYAHHPIWSADLMRAAGAADGAIWLAAHHQDDAAQWRAHPLYAALLRLQTADDLN
ncbi:MAG: hypothetical protein SGJ24_05535 [Chloroflexota bacterium]|nr:hypothetical protein [Chloroflexota bacterium]